MSTPVLATKLFAPARRSEFLTRPRLIEQLDAAVAPGRRMTLICAPAGFGKTTLVSDWIQHNAQRPSAPRVAWLSLDDGDNDPTRLLTHLVAALQGADPSIGSAALGLLNSASPPAVEATLTALINDVAATSGQTALVLDDYHVLDAPLVHEAVTFLLDHLPPQLHLMITSRADPPLPLARLRARGELVELRAAHLRFTPDEAENLLNQVLGLGLSDADVDALETRTEGWVAGLQLAAPSMRDRDDVSAFIGAFTGSNRFVLDYLVDEVLQRQPGDVRDFLLRTAVLDRLTGPLCDAVTGRDGGGIMLEKLERANLFLIALDEHRGWYRPVGNIGTESIGSRLTVPSLRARCLRTAGALPWVRVLSDVAGRAPVRVGRGGRSGPGLGGGAGHRAQCSARYGRGWGARRLVGGHRRWFCPGARRGCCG